MQPCRVRGRQAFSFCCFPTFLSWSIQQREVLRTSSVGRFLTPTSLELTWTVFYPIVLGCRGVHHSRLPQPYSHCSKAYTPKNMKNVIVKGWLLVIALSFALCCNTTSPAIAAKKKKKRKRKCAPCYRWSKKKRRCVFRCKVGKELCYRGRCIRIKRCSWTRCQRFDLRTNRCVNKCRKKQICYRGSCRKHCPSKLCYDSRKKRCVKRCPKGKRCVRRVCR